MSDRLNVNFVAALELGQLGNYRSRYRCTRIDSVPLGLALFALSCRGVRVSLGDGAKRWIERRGALLQEKVKNGLRHFQICKQLWLHFNCIA